MDAEVIVVGAGIIGLALAYELQRAEKKVILLEARAPGAEQSGGDARIFRIAHTQAELVPLAQAALRGWQRWESELSRQLISPCGQVLSGQAGAESERALRQMDAPARWLQPAEARLLLPGAPLGRALLDPQAGVLLLQRAVAAFSNLLSDSLLLERATQIVSRPEKAEVHLASGQILRARHAVVAAGRGAHALSEQSGFALPGSWHRHTRFTYPMRESGKARRWSAWSQRGVEGAEFYGLPVGDGAYALGLSGYLSTPRVEECSGQEWRELAQPLTNQLVEQYLPELQPRPCAAEDCWFLNSPLLSGYDGWHISQQGRVSWLSGVNLAKMAPELARQLAERILLTEK